MVEGLMLYGENTSKVIERLYEKLTSVQNSLPEGVRLIPYYEQAELVEKATGTGLHHQKRTLQLCYLTRHTNPAGSAARSLLLVIFLYRLIVSIQECFHCCSFIAMHGLWLRANKTPFNSHLYPAPLAWSHHQSNWLHRFESLG